jgi:hypothetical protein
MAEDKSTMLKDIAANYSIDYGELSNKYLPSKKNKVKGKIHKNDTIKCNEYQYGNKLYLVDNNNVVYENDPEHPKIVGSKLVDGTIKFLAM